MTPCKGTREIASFTRVKGKADLETGDNIYNGDHARDGSLRHDFKIA